MTAPDRPPTASSARWFLAATVCALALALPAVGVGWRETAGPDTWVAPAQGGTAVGVGPHGPAPARSGGRPPVTLAFAGDMHFQLQLAELLEHPRGALGPISRTLRAADLTMANLESAVATGGTPDPKELEQRADRYWFRASPSAFAVLADAGVDVVTVANNHGADYGRQGLTETLRARREASVAVVGVGRNRRDAFTPYRTTIRGTEIAVLAADASPREGMSGTWTAGPHHAGLAAAHSPRPLALLHAVRAARRTSDVVVVYLHWGTEQRSCPDPRQAALAWALADAGADVVVGSHAHVLQGSGWLGSTYVDYGLGNFLWYHDRQPETGILRVTLRDGEVVRDTWAPARIQVDGRPLPVRGDARARAIARWRGLRSCTDLAAHGPAGRRPAYSWSSNPIGPALAHRMRFSHHPGCPVPLADLRYLRMSYVGFDGRAHLGEMVVHETRVRAVASVFERLYDATWPIRHMRLVDDYQGDDGRSMAADNTSGFNCRAVAGSRSWSAHAYGDAIDINPVENPDLTGVAPAPVAGRPFAVVERSARAHPAPGVVAAGGPVVRAFAAVGWTWGGAWARPDYQHFRAGAAEAHPDGRTGRTRPE
jgi:poly-gamma-glutamate capsule biosynthesis protein CapA/YwtB (metallophosphatase superfamily)